MGCGRYSSGTSGRIMHLDNGQRRRTHVYTHIYIYIYIFWVVFCFFADVDGVGGGFVPLRLLSLLCLLFIDGNATTPIN